MLPLGDVFATGYHGVVNARVQPGDTILVHAGTYLYNRYEYTNNAAVNRSVPLDGTLGYGTLLFALAEANGTLEGLATRALRLAHGVDCQVEALGGEQCPLLGEVQFVRLATVVEARLDLDALTLAGLKLVPERQSATPPALAVAVPSQRRDTRS